MHILTLVHHRTVSILWLCVTPAATKSKSDKLAKSEKFKVQFFDAHTDWRIFTK